MCPVGCKSDMHETSRLCTSTDKRTMPDSYETSSLLPKHTLPILSLLSISTATTLMHTTILSLLKHYKCTLTGLPRGPQSPAIPCRGSHPSFSVLRKDTDFQNKASKTISQGRQNLSALPSTPYLLFLREGPELAALRGHVTLSRVWAVVWAIST